MSKFESARGGAERYAPVAERIRRFYERHPEGRIITELVHRDREEVVFKALVYRTSGEASPAATGWAAEREGDGEVNEVACLENTETSAVGRALANLGFTASALRPSAEEMAKASRVRVRLERQRRAATGVAEETPADRSADLAELLAIAARRGLPESKVRELSALLAEPVPAERLGEAMREVRRWLMERRENGAATL